MRPSACAKVTMPAPLGTQAKADIPYFDPNPNPNRNRNPTPTPNPNPNQAKANAIYEAHRSSPMCKPAPNADVAVKHAFVKSKYQVRVRVRLRLRPKVRLRLRVRLRLGVSPTACSRGRPPRSAAHP